MPLLLRPSRRPDRAAPPSATMVRRLAPVGWSRPVRLRAAWGAIGVSLAALVQAQPAPRMTAYVAPTDPAVRQKLEDWRDLKFGLLMHWGPYSQWGVVESWTLCPEDAPFTRRTKGSNPRDYFTYKREYEGLKHSFNPVGFAPEEWAEAARHAGMRYVVFTTKHHDGFAMFDTRYSDYKVTAPDCPFSANPRANLTREIFDAFRNKEFWIGAYFSKPDWHSEYYWSPEFPPFDRNVNYDPQKYPERWGRFLEFTHRQLMELMTDYGKVDILWLDGGWVGEKDAAPAPMRGGFWRNRVVSQDIRIDEVVAQARARQPGLIVVDRGVAGTNQNYLTPENRVPESPQPHPWESCITTTGHRWSWDPEEKFMSGREAIRLLVDIVAKGGNLLLNIAPGPDGRWPAGAYALLAEIGAWMAVNREAIYSTRAVSPYKTGNICLTQNKNTRAVYAILLAEGANDPLPESIVVEGVFAAPQAKVHLLGATGELPWENLARGLRIAVPPAARGPLAGRPAWTFRIGAIAARGPQQQ